MSSEYEQQLEKRNEELQSKLTALQSKHLEMETFGVELTEAMIRFFKKLQVKPTEGSPYDDGTKKLGANMVYKYLVRDDPTDRGEALLKKLLDTRYEEHLKWQQACDDSLSVAQKIDMITNIVRTEGTNERFYVIKNVNHEKE
jgi:hypothetical protein